MFRDFEEYKLKAQAFSDMLQEERDRLEEEDEAPAFSRYDPGSAFDDGFSLDTRVFLSKLESHYDEVHSIFARNMDMMKQLDISFLLAFALGHLEATYKNIDRLYEGGRKKYDLIEPDEDISYSRMSVPGVIYFRKTYAILTAEEMHSRILSIYRSTVRNVVFRADNIDDLMFFESVLLDDHAPMFMKLYSCLLYYIDNHDSRDPETAHPIEQLIIFYLAMWDHIIRNDLASENELLRSIRAAGKRKRSAV